MFIQMGDKKLKTTLPTPQTFITVGIRLKESTSPSSSFLGQVLGIRANGPQTHLDLDPSMARQGEAAPGGPHGCEQSLGGQGSAEGALGRSVLSRGTETGAPPTLAALGCEAEPRGLPVSNTDSPPPRLTTPLRGSPPAPPPPPASPLPPPVGRDGLRAPGRLACRFPALQIPASHPFSVLRLADLAG